MTPPRQREVSVGTFALALTALSLALVAYFGAKPGPAVRGAVPPPLTPGERS